MSSGSRYRVEVKRSAVRELGRLPRRVRVAIAAALDGLADDPRPPGVAALKGHSGLLRLRVAGAYRVVWRVDDTERTVTVLLIGDRKDVYRSLPR